MRVVIQFPRNKPRPGQVRPGREWKSDYCYTVSV